MRIATWNINGLRARMEFIEHWLRERKPDLVGLQELKQTDDKFPHAAFEALGYTAAVHGQKSWNGVAILSRKPLESVEVGLPGQEDLGARCVSARCGDLSFTTVYVPNGKNLDHDDYPRKLAWLDTLVEWWRGRHSEGEAAVLCGDLNLCPTDLDSWDGQRFGGQIFHTDAERARFQALQDTGLRDLFRERHPETQAFSWWDYRGGAFHRKQGLRIDFLLGTEAVVSKLGDVEIDRDWRKKVEGLTASDHAPVWADLS